MAIPVSIVCAQDSKTVWLKLEVKEDATVADVVQRADLPKNLPGLNLDGRKYGIFGKLATPETPVKPGDRIEVYVPALD